MIAQIKSKFTVYNYVFSADFNRNFPAMFTEAFRRFLIHLLTQRICGAKAWPTANFPPLSLRETSYSLGTLHAIILAAKK